MKGNSLDMCYDISLADIGSDNKQHTHALQKHTQYSLVSLAILCVTSSSQSEWSLCVSCNSGDPLTRIVAIGRTASSPLEPACAEEALTETN